MDTPESHVSLPGGPALALRAAAAGVRFVRGSHLGGGEPAFQIAWSQLPATTATRRTTATDLGRVVARLRVYQRLLVGFLDPIDDSLYLVAALRALGLPAIWCLGRQLAPDGPAGYLPWVECAGTVLSTSMPVREEYSTVYAYPDSATREAT